MALSREGKLDRVVDDAHLLELVRDTQAGGWWRVRDATSFVRPTLGARPGAILATDCFNIAFSPIIANIDRRMEECELQWNPRP
eukprot:8439808-Pyramimonas_sp.AAC.1